MAWVLNNVDLASGQRSGMGLNRRDLSASKEITFAQILVFDMSSASSARLERRFRGQISALSNE